MASIFRMPEVLANAGEAAVHSWLVAEGDSVTAGQPIAEIETEKADIEYNAEADGTILRLLVAEGESVGVGVPIVMIGAPGESGVEDLLGGADGSPVDAVETVSVPPIAAVPVPDAASSLPVHSRTASPLADRLFASPLVRRMARDRDLDLRAIAGSGPGGRIVRRDLNAGPAPTPAPIAIAEPAPIAEPASIAQATSADRTFTDIPHTRMRQAIARRLTESKSTVPHFYLVADCRVDALLELRERANEAADRRISVNDFVVAAMAKALREVPDANVIWTAEATRKFGEVDIAIAVSTEGGLLTPVLRGVDGLGIVAISEGIAELAARARAGTLKQHELEGGSFAVSNLGMYGVDEFSAIINPPQAAILAVGAAKEKAVAENGSVVAATVMTVTLSVDHRVIDGALAATWLAAFVRFIENPVSILL